MPLSDKIHAQKSKLGFRWRSPRLSPEHGYSADTGILASHESTAGLVEFLREHNWPSSLKEARSQLRGRSDKFLHFRGQINPTAVYGRGQVVRACLAR
jgi:hypothetical protein